MSGPRPEDFGAVPIKVRPEDFGAVPAIKIGAEGLPDAIKSVAGDYSGLSKAAIGAAGAVNSAAMRLKQLAGRDLTPQDIQGLEEYKALEKESGAAVAGNIAMNVLATLNPGAALYRGGAAAASKVLPAWAKFLAPTTGAAVSGAAVTAATQPTLEGETGAGNASVGALGAAGADAVTRGGARLVQPVVQSAPVQRLLKEGVVPTVGQAAGGFINRIEQQLESIPVVGWMITHARGRAVQEMNEAAIRKALPKGSKEQIEAGREGIERAGAVIDNAYDAAYGQIKSKVKVDQQFFKTVSEIPKREGIDLPPSLAGRFDQLVKDRVMARLADGADAETVRAAHNSLGTLSRKYRSSGDVDQRALGQALHEAKLSLREMVSRQSGGEFKATLDALDSKNAALKAVEKASGYQGSRDGVFSAEALKRASSKSSGEMRAFAGEAADVLGRTVPDSGTAGRVLLPTAMVRGQEVNLGVPALATGLLASPIYSRLGSRYMLGDFPAQATIAEMLRGSAPYTSLLGRSIASQ